LSISLEDARLHGGWLQAWGEPGRGAQFRLTLPLRAGDPLVRSPLPLAPADVAAGANVPPGGGGPPSNGAAAIGVPPAGEPSTGEARPGEAAGDDGRGDRPSLTGTGVVP
jgi:two-component system sensor histidine kinase MtrB